MNPIKNKNQIFSAENDKAFMAYINDKYPDHLHEEFFTEHLYEFYLKGKVEGVKEALIILSTITTKKEETNDN